METNEISSKSRIQQYILVNIQPSRLKLIVVFILQKG